MKPLDLLRIGAVCLIGMLGNIHAAEWSAAQAEVWAAIEACNANFREKRIDDAMDCIHDDFSGWLYAEPVPRGKDNFEKVGSYFMKTRETVAGELRPIDILVYDDFAIIHYFYIEVSKDEDGKEDYNQGRWTDIMIKEKGKWRWIADHGGTRPD
jgi:ketosteroid isomerase-like protein